MTLEIAQNRPRLRDLPKGKGMIRTKYEVRPYVPADYYKVKDGKPDAKLFLGVNEEEVARSYSARGVAFTGVVDGEILACAGVVILWPGMGEAWALVTPRIKDHKFFFHRTTLQYLDLIAQENHLDRIQANVQKDFGAGHRWAMSLGFRPEGDMLMFFGGMTFTRYGKIYRKGGTP